MGVSISSPSSSTSRLLLPVQRVDHIDSDLARKILGPERFDLSQFNALVVEKGKHGGVSASVFEAEVLRRFGLHVAWTELDADANADMQTDVPASVAKEALNTTKPLRCPFGHGGTSSGQRRPKVPLAVRGNTHQISSATTQLLREIGGRPTLLKMTTAFYLKQFASPHLSQFFRDKTDPHAERLASWVAEKMGGGTPWTSERKKRSQVPVVVAGGRTVVVHDRTSAHVAAWFSPKRPAARVGDHFKLDDCRVWMRLHFWACREIGLFENHPRFMEWYIRFIAHFVRVYERQAPVFTRSAARWSANSKVTSKYLKEIQSGRHGMGDVIGVPFSRAVQSLPENERPGQENWPYDNAKGQS